jgi:hypothetical protein
MCFIPKVELSARRHDILIQAFRDSPKILSSTVIQSHNKLIALHSEDSDSNLRQVNYNRAKLFPPLAPILEHRADFSVS